MAVALSFAFLLLADVRADPPSDDRPGPAAAGAGFGPRLRAIGLIGWVWIVLQGIFGGDSAGDVTTLFLWVYGWVGVAAVSALVGPIWHWLDPFATLFDIGAAVARRLGIRGWDAGGLPGAARSLAGRRRARVLRLARARRGRRRTELALHRPRRLHRRSPSR